MDSSPPSSSVHGISQARMLEWVAISFSNLKAYHRENRTFFFFPAQEGKIKTTSAQSY